MDESLKVQVDGFIAEWALMLGCEFEWMGPPKEVWGTIQNGRDVMHMGIVIQCKHIRCYFEPSVKAMNTVRGAVGAYFEAFDHKAGVPKIEGQEKAETSPDPQGG